MPMRSRIYSFPTFLTELEQPTQVRFLANLMVESIPQLRSPVAVLVTSNLRVDDADQLSKIVNAFIETRQKVYAV
jgi:hypothetical protein